MTIRAAILATEAASLEGYWPCDDFSTLVEDVSGLGRNLTVIGTNTFGATGTEGDAITFNGTSGHAYRNDSVIGTAPTQLSVVLWCKGNTTNDYLFAIGSSTEALTFVGLSTNGTGQLAAFARNAAGDVRLNVTDLGDVQDDAWHSVGLTHDGTTYRVFVDGVVVNETVAAFDSTLLDRTAIAALLRSTASSQYAGTIQHVAVWSVGLTNSDMLNIHNGGTALADQQTKQDRLFSFGNASLKYSAAWDANVGVKNNTLGDALLGDDVYQWVSRSGHVAERIPGTVAKLERSSIRPNEQVVKIYSGGFRYRYPRLTNPLASSSGAGAVAYSFVGAVDASVESTFAPILMTQRSSAPTLNTAGKGLAFRPNWASAGFGSDDSYIGHYKNDGGVLDFTNDSTPGGAGHWHSMVMRVYANVSDGAADFYFPGKQPPTHSATTNGPVLPTNNDDILIGCINWVDTTNTATSGEIVEIAHVGLWGNAISDQQCSDLATKLNQRSPMRKLCSYGDSRTFSLIFPGTMQLANDYGYLMHRVATGGWGPPDLAADIDLQISNGEYFDAAVIWIGINDLRVLQHDSDWETPFGELQTEILKGLASPIWGHVFLLNETPVNNSDYNQAAVNTYARNIELYFSGLSQVTVIDSWRTVNDRSNPASIDALMTSDGVHLTPAPALANGSYHAYMRILHDRTMPIIQEHFGDLTTTAASEGNAASLLRGLQSGSSSQVATDAAAAKTAAVSANNKLTQVTRGTIS